MTDVKMRANENYWGGAPKADTVELKIIDDQDALDMALANGEIDPVSYTHLFVNKSDYLICTSGRLNTPLNVNMNHVVLIQMLSKIRCFSDLKFFENFFRIQTSAVIRSEHIRRD